MTTKDAQAALDKIESDEAFAQRVKESGGPDAALATIQAEGFDVTAQELGDATLDRYGDQLNMGEGEQLSPEQLDSISGGIIGPGMEAAVLAGCVSI